MEDITNIILKIDTPSIYMKDDDSILINTIRIPLNNTHIYIYIYNILYIYIYIYILPSRDQQLFYIYRILNDPCYYPFL